MTDKDLVLKEFKDTAKAGLNYPTYDLSVDSIAIVKYQSWVNENKGLNDEEKKIIPADNKKYYLKPGKYIVEIETSKGVKARQEFVIKPKEKEEGHGGMPGAGND
jgi:hypothetical protein